MASAAIKYIPKQQRPLPSLMSVSVSTYMISPHLLSAVGMVSQLQALQPPRSWTASTGSDTLPLYWCQMRGAGAIISDDVTRFLILISVVGHSKNAFSNSSEFLLKRVFFYSKLRGDCTDSCNYHNFSSR